MHSHENIVAGRIDIGLKVGTVKASLLSNRETVDFRSCGPVRSNRLEADTVHCNPMLLIHEAAIVHVHQYHRQGAHHEL